MNIVTLLPSATEIIYFLGLVDQLVGVSHDCDWPEEINSVPTLTSSLVSPDQSSRSIDEDVKELSHDGRSIYHLDGDELDRLNPDLVLTQELCDVCAPSYDQVMDAVKIEDGTPEILSLEPTNLDEILETIRVVGRYTDSTSRARDLIHSLEEFRETLKASVDDSGSPPRVLSLEWLDPMYVGGHWVPQMIQLAGGQSFQEVGEHSTEITRQQALEYDPEVIIAMPCGYSRAETREILQETNIKQQLAGTTAVQEDQLYAVHGSHYFNRPGPRIFDGLIRTAELIQQTTFSVKSVEERLPQVT